MTANLKDLKQELWLRLREKGVLTWTNQYGQTLLIKNMSDQHLINTINMLERQEEERRTYEAHKAEYEVWHWEKL